MSNITVGTILGTDSLRIHTRLSVDNVKQEPTEEASDILDFWAKSVGYYDGDLINVNLGDPSHLEGSLDLVKAVVVLAKEVIRLKNELNQVYGALSSHQNG